MNRAGGHLLSAQDPPSLLLCCHQPAFHPPSSTACSCTDGNSWRHTRAQNEQVWGQAAGGVQPREDTGLGIPKGKRVLPVCFSPEAPQLECALMTHWLKLGHTRLPSSAPAKAEPYHSWSVRPPALPCGHQGKSLWTRKTRRGLGGLPAALPACAALAPHGAEGRWLRAGTKTSVCPSSQ